MTDRELLELAAKAAGIQYEIDNEGMWTRDPWFPLTDDGDALRLVVKLRFEIDICHTGIAVRTDNRRKIIEINRDFADPYAATRRAIVRAAAEIGKGMK